MKKLLVLLVSAALVLSLAAVSMASVEVSGEFDYIYTLDSTLDDESELKDGFELNIEVLGKVSETVSAYVNIYTDQDEDKSFTADEYYMLFTPEWATFTVGYFDWDLTPSVDIIAANDLDVFPRTDTLFTVEVPFGNGFSAGLAYAVDGNDPDENDNYDVQDGAFDVKFAYANDIFGGEIHYSDTATEDTTGEYFETNMAVNVWYNPLENLQLFVAGNSPEYVDDVKEVDEEVLLGFYWSNIGATPFGLRGEYIVTEREESTGDKWNPYGVRLEYQFSNNLIFELEHSNFFDIDGTNDEENVTSLTAKVLF